MDKDCCHTEKQLLQKISEGDENAFNEMVCRYTPALYATALAYLKIAANAEDAVQEVFYKV
jgi:DNA-directed RNA polymerase specialized sigma24 family protein